MMTYGTIAADILIVLVMLCAIVVDLAASSGRGLTPSLKRAVTMADVSINAN
jgi:hypothetical protein